MVFESREATKTYGRKTAVDHVSLELEAGFVYAMLGPNGSGKTTWMKMAAGLVKPNSGGIRYQNQPIGIESKKEIAYMSTEPYFYSWMTVADVGKYYEDFFDDFSMDLLARDEIMRTILASIEPDVTMVISSHLIDELERVADAVLFMKEGHLIRQCMVEELRISQHKSVADLYREIYGHGGEAVC